MATATEIIAKLGIKVSKASLNSISSIKKKLGEVAASFKKVAAAAAKHGKAAAKAMDKMAQSAKNYAAVAVGMVAAKALLAKKFIDDAAAIKDLSDRINVSTDDIQKWTYAAKAAGVNSEALLGDIENLQKARPGQDIDKYLDNLADSLKNMSESNALRAGEALGLSKDTILLLRKGTDEVRALKAEAESMGAIISKEEIERAQKFRNTFDKLKYSLGQFATLLSLSALPLLEKMSNSFSKWFQKNKEWIKLKADIFMKAFGQAFDRVGKIIDKVVKFFEPFIKKIKEFIPAGKEADTVSRLLVGAFGVLAIALAPLAIKAALVMGAFLLLSLIVDDFITFLEGGDSVIGRFFDAFKEKYPEAYEALSKIADFLKGAFVAGVETAKAVFNKLGDAFSKIGGTIMETFNDIAKPFNEFVNEFEERFPNLIATGQKVADLLKGALADAFDFIVVRIQDFISLIGVMVRSLGWLYAKIMDGVEWLLEDNSTGESVIKSSKKGYEVGTGNRIPDAERANMPMVQPISPEELQAIRKLQTQHAAGVQIGAPGSNLLGGQQVVPVRSAGAGGEEAGAKNIDKSDRRNYDIKVNQTITPSDPIAAANSAKQGFYSAFNQTSPGLHAPIAN